MISKNEAVNKWANEDLTETEKKDAFSFLLHIPNYAKTDGEWACYLELSKEYGFPEPNRSTTCRPLFEKVVQKRMDEIISENHKKTK